MEILSRQHVQWVHVDFPFSLYVTVYYFVHILRVQCIYGGRYVLSVVYRHSHMLHCKAKIPRKRNRFTHTTDTSTVENIKQNKTKYIEFYILIFRAKRESE